MLISPGAMPTEAVRKPEKKGNTKFMMAQGLRVQGSGLGRRIKCRLGMSLNLVP
jgi:hypothetical protein